MSSIPSLMQMCCRFLATNCNNKNELIYGNDLIPDSLKKNIFNYSGWYLEEEKYTHYEKYIFSENPQSEKIDRITIRIFKDQNHRLELDAQTGKLEVYFEIIEKAQALSKRRYVFNSLHSAFLPDSQGLCTVRAVRNWCDRLSMGYFARSYLELPLGYNRTCRTLEELFQKIEEALDILQQVDHRVQEVAGLLIALRKNKTSPEDDNKT